MTLTATLSGQTEREPFNAETYFANPDQYDVEYRNGEKPLRVIDVPECENGYKVISVTKTRIESHSLTGKYLHDQYDCPLDLFMRRRTDPAESLRGKCGLMHKDVVYNSEGEIPWTLRTCGAYHVIQFK